MKKYSVFQIKDDAANSRYVKFSSYEWIEKMDIKLSLDMYENIYEGEIEAEADETASETLDHIFMVLNIGRKPEGYRGHSLSMSDVILMDGIYYYVDEYGFKELDLGGEPKPQRKEKFTVLVMNTSSMRKERKSFNSQAEADAYYEKRKSQVELALPEKEKWFSYRNEWGNMMHIQKMY